MWILPPRSTSVRNGNPFAFEIQVLESVVPLGDTSCALYRAAISPFTDSSLRYWHVVWLVRRAFSASSFDLLRRRSGTPFAVVLYVRFAAGIDRLCGLGCASEVHSGVCVIGCVEDLHTSVQK